MTEIEWLSADDPLPMLIFLRGEPPEDLDPMEPRGIVSDCGVLHYGPGEQGQRAPWGFLAS